MSETSKLVGVRLTKFEALLLDLLAHQEYSRGQVVREALHVAFRARLLLSPEQTKRLSREIVVRRRAPKRKFDRVKRGVEASQLFPPADVVRALARRA